METAALKQRITQDENATTEFKENFDHEAKALCGMGKQGTAL